MDQQTLYVQPAVRPPNVRRTDDKIRQLENNISELKRLVRIRELPYDSDVNNRMRARSLNPMQKTLEQERKKLQQVYEQALVEAYFRET